MYIYCILIGGRGDFAFFIFSGSGLASIFGGGGSGDTNASLTYTAPKQPKKSSKSELY